ncbi:hypothetical protein [Tepidibacter formicigenes]|jgi:uncharacterized membrane protein YqhA|uniref:Uncharacterized protein n=1 Tax=Tepidibacter formicigenes DSM 15518 TaxID=1123349 RepID=A0A1M6MGI2_9FIRM|nr:hypothetical protein [Tepidibacter formicigenes]SHJ82443.1 hypothetical protein SAMN02744037_00930 [Tepidibacter formicigenes DSM 15518]
MVLLFQGINLVILFLVLIIPSVGTYYFIKYLRNKEDNKDEILARVILLEKRVKELEDYISDSE